MIVQLDQRAREEAKEQREAQRRKEEAKKWQNEMNFLAAKLTNSGFTNVEVTGYGVDAEFAGVRIQLQRRSK